MLLNSRALNTIELNAAHRPRVASVVSAIVFASSASGYSTCFSLVIFTGTVAAVGQALLSATGTITLSAASAKGASCSASITFTATCAAVPIRSYWSMSGSASHAVCMTAVAKSCSQGVLI